MCTFSPHNIYALQCAWASGKVSSTALHICDEILPYFFSIQHFSYNIHEVICQHCDMTM